VLPQITEATTLLEFYRQLATACPIVDGKLLDCTFVVADGPVKVFPHGLGRAYRGATIVGSTQAGTVTATLGAPIGPFAVFDAIYIALSASADVTLRVWVF
jgi:hypothetical protein